MSVNEIPPNNLTPAVAQRGSRIHAQQTDNQSRGNSTEDISRLQSAVQPYSDLLTYKIGDFTIEAGIMYRCITAILFPESFTPINWKEIDANSPVEIGRAVVPGAPVSSIILTLNRITKYIKINFSAINATGVMMLELTFNGDKIAGNSRYAENDSINFAGPSTSTMADLIMLTDSPDPTDDYNGEITLTNIANKVKVGHTQIISSNGTDASKAPFIRESVILWINVVTQIATIEFVDIGAGNGIGTDSEFIAMGWD